MTIERMPEGMPARGAAGQARDPDAAARALKAQLLATEHWSLLATRSLSWNESFSRASMFLTLLSGAVVALALVAQASSFGDAFATFALLLLPVVLFVGLATYVRLVEVNNEDVVWVVGMNRLRRAYLELDPSLAEHFVTGWTEDRTGIMRTYGSPTTDGGLAHGFVTTPAMIGFVDAMLAAILAAVVLVRLGGSMLPAAGLALVTFALTVAALAWFGYRSIPASMFMTGTAAGAGRRDEGDGAA